MKVIYASGLFFIFFQLASLLNAQDGNIDHLLDEASVELRDSNFLYAIEKASLVLNVARQEEEWQQFYKGASLILKALKKQNDLQQALDSISSWLILIPDEEHGIIGKLYFHQGIIYLNQGRIYSTFLPYQKAIDHFKQTGNKRQLSKLYENLSYSYSRVQEYSASRSYAYLALKSLPENPKLLYKKDVLTDHIAKTYMWEGDIDKAIEILLGHEKESRKLSKDSEFLLIEYYVLNGQELKAEAKLNSLLRGHKDVPSLAMLSAQKTIEVAKGNLPKAISLQKEICKRIPRKFTEREYIKERIVLAKLYYENEEYLSAEAIVDRVLIHYDFDIERIDSTRKLAGKNSYWNAEALYLKGLILSEDYLNRDKNKALLFIETAMDVLKMDRAYVINNREKYALASREKEYAQTAIEFLYHSWKTSHHSSIFERAFVLNQQSNAKVLMESLNDQKVLEYCSLPDEIMSKWLSLKNFLSNSPLDSLPDELINFKNLEHDIRKICPAYEHMQTYAPASIPEIRKKLTTNDRLIAYQKMGDKYHVFAIGKDTLIWDIVNKSNLVDTMTNQIFEILSEAGQSGEDEKQFISNASYLYDILIHPYITISSHSQPATLYIIPDGTLRFLPFDALITKEASSWIQPDVFLINDYDISYLYYASQLVMPHTSSAENIAFTGFGLNYSDDYFSNIVLDTTNFRNNDFSFVENISPLRESESEVMEISNRWSGKCYIGKEVNHKTVTALLAQSNIIHFATHTLINDKNNIESSLLLYPDSLTGNYKLTYLDILNIRLSSDLVVLSSCQSLYGQLYDSEGILSLGRAFVESGVNGVVGNLWNVSDQMAPKLMIVFYENLQKGIPASRALRLAKLDYLTDDKFNTPSIQTPHYWAGWRVYGSPTTSYLNKDKTKISYVKTIFIMLISLITIIFFAGKKRSAVK